MVPYGDPCCSEVALCLFCTVIVSLRSLERNEMEKYILESVCSKPVHIIHLVTKTRRHQRGSSLKNFNFGWIIPLKSSI